MKKYQYIVFMVKTIAAIVVGFQYVLFGSTIAYYKKNKLFIYGSLLSKMLLVLLKYCLATINFKLTITSQ